MTAEPQVGTGVPDTYPVAEPNDRTDYRTPMSGIGTGLYFDVDGLLAGTMPEPPSPSILTRDDGHAIFYAGEVNVLFGDPESGKSWIADAAAAETLRNDGRVAILDLDHNGPASTVSRLLSLGAPESALRDLGRFRYAEPYDRTELDAVLWDLAHRDNEYRWAPTLAVVDSLGELVPIYGGSSNSPDEFTVVHGRVMKPLAACGAAVVVIDHLAKNADSRAQGATGTAAKRRVVGGAAIRVKVLTPFKPGEGGTALLKVHKDRHGGLRRWCPSNDREPVAGTFTMTATSDDRLDWTIRKPKLDDHDPDEAQLLADVDSLDALDPSPATLAEARKRLGINQNRASAAYRIWQERQTPQRDDGTQETLPAEVPA